MTSKMADPYDLPLTSFMVGRYARETLRLSLEGLVLSDIDEMDMETFLLGVEVRDRHLAVLFWTNVLTPVWKSWSIWKGLAPERVAVEDARRSLQNVLAKAQGNGVAPNNDQRPVQ